MQYYLKINMMLITIVLEKLKELELLPLSVKNGKEKDRWGKVESFLYDSRLEMLAIKA